MKPERWAEIEPVLDELLDLPPNERLKRLETLTTEDPELRADVERYLDETGESDGPLDGSLDTFAAAVFDEETSPRDPSDREGGVSATGRQIGPYRALSEIGRGGMGSVLLAERTDGEFEHRVALKLVRGGRPEIVERFRHERQILARLRHPNIATLFDGGATEEGEPYFAMEYVDGERITDYCDRNRLDLDARVTLFGDVCRAVQYAHRNLVVHRDLKPSNVLVTKDGTVKLLDFGIAKIVDTDGDAGVTTTLQFLTPAYAAPEQILAEPTSTATDIYSLGVVLYELLTGRNPHGDTSRSAHVARAVVDTDPPSASTAVGESQARERGGNRDSIRRALRGDLDNILQKALRKSPEERYGSAEDLRADLERHRKRLPVSARPATLGYRLSRFARRNRVGAAAMVGVVLAVVAGVAGIAWQAAVAAEERDRARAQAVRAEASSAFLLDVFSAADPTDESGEVPTAVELAERGADRIRDSFAGDPEVRADVTGMLGTVFLRLGEYARADTLLNRAYDEYVALGNDEKIVGTLIELGDTYQWQRRLAEAEASLDAAVEHGERTLGADHELLPAARMGLGVVYHHQGEYERAENILRETLPDTRRVHGQVSKEMSRHLVNLTTALRRRDDLVGAAEAAAEAVEIQRTLNAQGGVNTARAIASLADIIDDLDRREESVALSREAIEMFRREYGDEGHSELAIAISNLAGTLRSLGRVEEAITLGSEVIEIFERKLGPEHAYLARAHNNLAVSYKQLGDDESAAREYAESIRIARLSFGPRHPAIVAFLGNYGSLLMDLGRLEESEATYREAISIADESETDAFGRTYSVLGLGGVMRKTGRLAEAEKLTHEAWETRVEIVGEGHSAELHARITLASIISETGRNDEARPILDAAVADCRAGLPATRSQLIKALEERAIVARDSGEPSEAHAGFLRELIAAYHEIDPNNPAIPRLQDTLEALVGN